MKHARSLFSALLVAALPLASLAGGPIKVELGAGSAGVALSGYGFSPLMVQRSYWFAPLAAYQQWHAQNPSLPDALAGLDLNRPGDQALAAPLLRAFSRQDLSLQYDLPGIAKLDVAKAQALNGVLVEAVRQAARRSRSKIEQVAGQLLRQARQREGDADALAAAQAFLRKAAALYGEQAGSDSISQAEQQVGSMVESLRGKKVEQTVDAGAAALQTAAALPTHNSVSLADFKGKTFLQALTDPSGIKAKLDEAEQAQFTFADAGELVATIHGHFEPRVVSRLTSLFTDGEDGLITLAQALQGRQATPKTAAGIIADQLKSSQLLAKPGEIGLAAVKLAPVLSLASGAGTLVSVDGGIYNYQFGYKPGGEDDRAAQNQDVKSGRGYSVSPGMKALDPSDNDYLEALGQYIKEEDPTDFIAAILNLLANCDVSGAAGLSRAGQALFSHFVAIYIAEADRYAMTGEKTHSWQEDLLEVTLLSAFGAKSGVVLRDGRLVDGVPKDWFALGRKTATNPHPGSGIGETRRDRRRLQAAATQAVEQDNPELIEAIVAALGSLAQGDAIHSLAAFLNDSQNQEKVGQKAAALIKAFKEFAAGLYNGADQIRISVQQSLQ